MDISKTSHTASRLVPNVNLELSMASLKSFSNSKVETNQPLPAAIRVARLSFTNLTRGPNKAKFHQAINKSSTKSATVEQSKRISQFDSPKILEKSEAENQIFKSYTEL